MLSLGCRVFLVVLGECRSEKPYINPWGGGGGGGYGLYYILMPNFHRDPASDGYRLLCLTSLTCDLPVPPFVGPCNFCSVWEAPSCSALHTHSR